MTLDDGSGPPDPSRELVEIFFEMSRDPGNEETLCRLARFYRRSGFLPEEVDPKVYLPWLEAIAPRNRKNRELGALYRELRRRLLVRRVEVTAEPGGDGRLVEIPELGLRGRLDPEGGHHAELLPVGRHEFELAADVWERPREHRIFHHFHDEVPARHRGALAKKRLEAGWIAEQRAWRFSTWEYVDGPGTGTYHTDLDSTLYVWLYVDSRQLEIHERIDAD